MFKNTFVMAKALAVVAVLSVVFPINPVFAQSALNQYIAQTVSGLSRSDQAVKNFYADRNFEPMWVGKANRTRQKALIDALETSGDHALPTANYRAGELEDALKRSRTAEQQAVAEVIASKAFLRYAQDISSGVLNASRLDDNIAVRQRRLNPEALLDAMSKSTGRGFMEALAPGMSNGNVQILRERLSGLGYGNLGNSPDFDERLYRAVQRFQQDHGLNTDGVVGRTTIQFLNFTPQDRMIKVMVNLERQRWLNFKRGARHIVVNIPAFEVNMYDNGKPSFTSRVVVGVTRKDQTPEFYDEMTYMVINPTWHVPASIAGKEYLPILQEDPGFLSRQNMKMFNEDGAQVNPASLDLTAYNEKNFPYNIKQQPDPGNALGRVKFMFPNRFNIYLHDTPAKNLFSKDLRTFSHGCIRVQKPFEFAYTLLRRQTSDPQGFFKRYLDTGKETYVNLKQSIPVYVTYSTAFVDQDGEVKYRADVYGRDATVFNALTKAGVAMQATRG
jgi:murein L,D-transpeptidase YcbB/YkuD